MISIVSAYYKNEEMTIEFLDNLEKNCKDYNIEMILVNAGSIPIEHSFVTKRIDLEKNISFSNSMNSGLKEVTGDYVVIIGNDGFPKSPDWLNELLKYLDEDIWITAPVFDNPGFQSYNVYLLEENEDVALMHMYPAVLWCLKKETLDLVGLFDERFLIGCYEDNDYVERVHRLGGKILVNKKIKIHHKLSQTLNLLGSQEINNNRIKFFEKYKNGL